MSRPLRVLAICHEDIDYVLGGMGMHVRELYRFMARRDDVEIDLLNGGIGQGSQVYNGFTRHFPSCLTTWKPRCEGMTAVLLQDYLLLKTFQRLLAEGRRWDVVHAHEWGSLNVAWACREALGVPLVGTMHLCMTHLTHHGDGGEERRAPERDPLDRIIAELAPDDAAVVNGLRAAARHPSDQLSEFALNQEARLVVESDETILCSQAYVDLARKTFLSDVIGKRYNLIYNGIDPEVWHPRAGDPSRARAKHGIKSNRPIALYVGRIATMKGVVPLLDAIEAVDTGYLVVMAGAINATTQAEADQWSVTKRIRALQAKYPERLKWVDYQYGQDLKDLYALANVGLMPSTHEPFGLVALEFMAMGVPLICTEVDGLGEIVAPLGDHGDEYAMIIPAACSEAIVEALDVLQDRNVRRELIDLGLRRIRDFSWPSIVDQTVQVYRDAIRRVNNGKAEAQQKSSSNRSPAGGGVQSREQPECADSLG